MAKNTNYIQHANGNVELVQSVVCLSPALAHGNNKNEMRQGIDPEEGKQKKYYYYYYYS